MRGGCRRGRPAPTRTSGPSPDRRGFSILRAIATGAAGSCDFDVGLRRRPEHLVAAHGLDLVDEGHLGWPGPEAVDSTPRAVDLYPQRRGTCRGLASHAMDARSGRQSLASHATNRPPGATRGSRIRRILASQANFGRCRAESVAWEADPAQAGGLSVGRVRQVDKGAFAQRPQKRPTPGSLGQARDLRARGGDAPRRSGTPGGRGGPLRSAPSPARAGSCPTARPRPTPSRRSARARVW